MKLRAIMILASIAHFTACTSASHVKPLSESPQEFDPNQEEVSQLMLASEAYHEELKRKGLLYSDEETNTYVNRIGSKLAPEFLTTNNGLNIFILKDATANAAALPNGNIYVNIGLLSVAESEDQLAAILAHELGHVIYRHSLKQMLNRQDTRRAANIADIFLLGTGLSYIPAQGALASYSREQEREADEMSLQYMNQGEYDLRQVPEIFRVFQQLPEALTVKNSVYSSHPDNKERIEYLEQKIQDEFPNIHREPVKSAGFANSRQKIVETNVRIRLQDHQYELAWLTLEQAEKYYKRAALIQYYRGEVYRLKADNPEKAAKEMEWLSGGDQKQSSQEDDMETDPVKETDQADAKDKDLDYFTSNRDAHYRKAESFYYDALQINPDLAVAYKGLGLVSYSTEDYQKAVQYLTDYLDRTKTPDDRLYINRIIRNSKKRI